MTAPRAYVRIRVVELPVRLDLGSRHLYMFPVVFAGRARLQRHRDASVGAIDEQAHIGGRARVGGFVVGVYRTPGSRYKCVRDVGQSGKGVHS